MIKRDEVALTYCPGPTPGLPYLCAKPCDVCGEKADAILALLSDPDDRMVEAAAKAMQKVDYGVLRFDELSSERRAGYRKRAKAAIRAAMKAAGY
jgi:hypothetical protein